MTQRVSFRDPDGRVFWHNGQVYRAVFARYQPIYDDLVSTGTYASLMRAGLLVPHEEVADPAVIFPGGEVPYKILRPEPLTYLSQPQEWCFSMLQAAAITTLSVQLAALRHGFVLKDAPAHNVQFHQGRAVLIDTLSLVRYEPGQAWQAYGQFCRHFVAPLCLAAFTDARLVQLFSAFPDGIPLGLAAKLLPLRAKLNGGILWHLVFHAQAEARAEVGAGPKKPLGQAGTKPANRNFNLAFLTRLTESLLALVRRIRYRPQTPWSQYYQTEVAEAYAQSKRQWVEKWLAQAAPARVWDLGANTGEFARLAAAMGIATYAFDADHDCIELLARQNAQAPPLVAQCLQGYVVDLTNPTAGSGWCNTERSGWWQRPLPDLVLALALVHHLRISANVPLAQLATFFAALAPQAIVEFVPKSDERAQRLLRHKADLYADYTPEGLEQSFAPYFSIRAKVAIPSSERVLYWFARHTSQPVPTLAPNPTVPC